MTLFETHRFQRIWINLPDYTKNTIAFDIFIRVKDDSGNWMAWEREQMTEKMWGLPEVTSVLHTLKQVRLIHIFGDDFTIWKPGTKEPNLAYILLQKH